MTKTPTPAEAQALLGEHRTMGKLFERHQEALVGLQLELALGDLEDFARRLRHHIRMEETVLLPVCAAMTGLPRSGRLEFFRAEHRKIMASLDAILTAARTLNRGPGERSAVVVLMDRESRFKALLDHHERREETVLLRRFGAAVAVGAVEPTGKGEARSPEAC
jgi:hypothetical protein